MERDGERDEGPCRRALRPLTVIVNAQGPRTQASEIWQTLNAQGGKKDTGPFQRTLRPLTVTVYAHCLHTQAPRTQTVCAHSK